MLQTSDEGPDLVEPSPSAVAARRFVLSFGRTPPELLVEFGPHIWPKPGQTWSSETTPSWSIPAQILLIRRFQHGLTHGRSAHMKNCSMRQDRPETRVSYEACSLDGRWCGDVAMSHQQFARLLALKMAAEPIVRGDLIPPSRAEKSARALTALKRMRILEEVTGASTNSGSKHQRRHTPQGHRAMSEMPDSAAFIRGGQPLVAAPRRTSS